VKRNRIQNAVIPKDHSNALVLLDTQVTTMEKLVKVNIVRVRTSFIRLAHFFALGDCQFTHSGSRSGRNLKRNLCTDYRVARKPVPDTNPGLNANRSIHFSCKRDKCFMLCVVSDFSNSNLKCKQYKQKTCSTQNSQN